jgi:sensor histidine kinase YesM
MRKLKKILKDIMIVQLIGVLIGLFLSTITNNLDNVVGYVLISMVMTNSMRYSFLLCYHVFLKYFRNEYTSKIVYVLPAIIASIIGFELGSYLNLIIFNVRMFPSEKHGIMLLTYVVIGIIIALLFYSYKKLEHRLAAKIKENERLKRLKLKAKLDELQSKLNPHFLFNTFNSIVQLVDENPKKVEKMILNLSDIYRTILNLNENNLITIKDEISLIEKYLMIEKIRMDERLNFDISVKEEMNELKIPPFSIEVLVENAIIHGLSSKKEGGAVRVYITKRDDFCRIEVSDNGAGFDRVESKGFGLYSVEERLKLIYNNEYSFNIESMDSGTKVIMEVPLDYENGSS